MISSRLASLSRLALLTALGASLIAGPGRARADQATMVMSLQQALEMALLNNLDLQGARLDAQIAEAQVKGSKGPFDPIFFSFFQHRNDVEPQVSAVESTFTNGIFDTYQFGLRQELVYGGSYEVSLGTSRVERGQSVGLTPAYQANIAMKYTQPLLRGFGRDENGYIIDKALNSSKIARRDFEVRARDLARDTVVAYWNLVFSVEDLKVKRASLALAEELLRKNKIMVDVGTLAPLEITQAEASVAQRKFDIISAEAAVGSAEDALRRLLGVEEGSASWNVRLMPADRAEFQAAMIDPADALARALSLRPELDAATLTRENARLDMEAAKDARRPQLDLNLTLEPAGLAGDLYGIDPNPLVDTDGDGDPTNDNPLVSGTEPGSAWDQVSSWDFTSWSAGLSYTQPLLNRAAKADYTTRRLQLEQRDIDLRALRQAITLEVRAALRDLDSARERIGAASAARTLQQKKLDAEVKKFENGLSTNFEVLQFQTDLQESESSELLARTDYLRALAEVRRNRGTLLEDYGLQAPR